MAEFCIDCLNELNESNDKAFRYVRCWGVCEECGRYTKVVIRERAGAVILEFVFLPVSICFAIVKFIIVFVFDVCKKIIKRTKIKKNPKK